MNVLRPPLQTRIGMALFVLGLAVLTLGIVVAFPLDLPAPGKIVIGFGGAFAFWLAPSYDLRHRRPPAPPTDPQDRHNA